MSTPTIISPSFPPPPSTPHTPSFEAPHACPKRIIICCDGTWQSSVTSSVNVPSNVTRLARLLSKSGLDDSGSQWQQLVYYDAGIGTGVFKIEAALQGGTGSGFVGNVIEAYNFIVLNYLPGDQIFCIGFSRGAYTARAVAGLVTDIGIVSPRDMQDFPELYTIYQNHTDGLMFRKTREWREWVEGVPLYDAKEADQEAKEVEKEEGERVPEEWRRTMWKRKPHRAPAESTRWVEAVGVFDTVGALGIPEVEGIAGLMVKIMGLFLPVEKFGFHNVELSPYIRHAFHALALDEHRRPFDATLWHLPADGIARVPESEGSSFELRQKFNELKKRMGVKEKELDEAWGPLVAAEMSEELKDSQSELVQVWFPGVHINVGGGSDDLLKEKRGDLEQIALITLHWMMSRLAPHLTFVDGAAKRAADDRILQMRPVVDEIITSGNTSHWLMRKIQATIENNNIYTPDLWKNSGDDGTMLKRVLAADALVGWGTGPIIDSYTGSMTKAGSKYRTPGEYKESKRQDGKAVNLGDTNEFIHPTVRYRMEHLGQTAYNPPALWEYVKPECPKGENHSGLVWKKRVGTGEIPEWRISGTNAFERACVQSSSSRKWLADQDKVFGIHATKPESVIFDTNQEKGQVTLESKGSIPSHVVTVTEII